MIEALHSYFPSPILITYGSLVIRWYGLFLAVGAVCAYLVASYFAERSRVPSNTFTTMAVVLIVAGFLGARLYHVANEPSYYAANPGEIFKLWHGGLAIHGALIAGLIALIIMSRRAAIPLLRLTDSLLPGVALGQAIGRWGNYFNQELFGKPTDLPWGIPIRPEHRPEEFVNSPYFHPTFLYESLWDFGVFLLLSLLLLRSFRMQGSWARHPGAVTAIYCILIGIGRVLSELFRIDQTPIILGIRLPLLVSAALCLVGLAILWHRQRRIQQSVS